MHAKQETFLAEGGAISQTDRLINHLHRASPDWVGLPELVSVVGGYAIHSRANDARARGVNIENRVDFDRTTKKRISFYRILAP